MRNQFLLPSLFCIVTVLLTHIATAQKITVKGKITQEDGSAVAGVSVEDKSTKTGATSDANGDYSVSVPGPNSVLVFSYVGYASQEIAVNNRSVINVQLAISNTKLNEVVVVGYGTQKAKDVTGSVVSLGAKEFNQGPQLSPQQLIQGKMAIQRC